MTASLPLSQSNEGIPIIGGKEVYDSVVIRIGAWFAGGIHVEGAASGFLHKDIFLDLIVGGAIQQRDCKTTIGSLHDGVFVNLVVVRSKNETAAGRAWTISV